MKTRKLNLKKHRDSAHFFETDIGILKNGLCDILCFADNCILKDDGMLVDDAEEFNIFFETTYFEIG